MTNRKLRRLSAALLALSLACGAWAETVPANDVQTAIPTEAPSAEPTLKPTETAAPEPTEMPTEEPTEEPAAEPSENPTEEPTEAPTIEPTTTPTAEPTEAPTADPTDMPTVAPAEIPAVNPTSEPSDAPQDNPLPGEAQEGAIRIAAEGNVQIVDGVNRITLSQPGEGPSFTWQTELEASEFIVYVQNADGTLNLAGRTTEQRISVSKELCSDGTSTLWVGALMADGAAVWSRLFFALENGGVVPGGGGSPSGGGFPSRGGFSAGGMPSASGEAPADEELHITPGEALTDSHASGTKEMQLYGTVALEPSNEAATALVMGGETLPVQLVGGDGAFTAALDGQTLILTPQNGGTLWSLDGRTLKTLMDSGVESIVFELNGAQMELDTAAELCGENYGALRARGFVSKDFFWTLSADGIRIQADGETWSLGENGELTRATENS